MKVVCVPITTGIGDIFDKAIRAYHVSRAGTLVRSSYKCMWDQSNSLISNPLIFAGQQKGKGECSAASCIKPNIRDDCKYLALK